MLDELAAREPTWQSVLVFQMTDTAIPSKQRRVGPAQMKSRWFRPHRSRAEQIHPEHGQIPML